MFDNYVLSPNSIKNWEANGKITGFQLKTLISYYRGIPLSMIHDIHIKADGEEIPRNFIKFSANGSDYFTLDEMETVTTYKWEYGQEAVIFVEKEGGLAKGKHEITLTQAIRVSYIPVPFEGTRTEVVNIA
jgi:hypothetical protein